MKKDKVLYLRISEEEQIMIKTSAAAAGITISAYVRALLKEHPIYARQDRDLMDKLIHQINKIGVNINQIAYHINSGLVHFEDEIDLKDAIRSLENILSEVQNGNS